MKNKPFVYYLRKFPNYLFSRLLCFLSPILSDKFYLSILYRLNMGSWMSFKHPIKFSEKLQWLKLYDRNPEYTKLVDKNAVKDYVSGIIGGEYVIPTLGIWEKPEDIEWDKLPNKFVLKTTHSGGSTGVVICKDKSSFNQQRAVEKLRKSLKQDTYQDLREWPYKNVPKRILAEKYISPAPGQNDLPDYKFFCFNGEPIFCQVISGRNEKMSIDFFDRDWNHQPFHEPKQFPFASVEPSKPLLYEKMWDLARQLAVGKAFSRIDFYEVNNTIYFGEITFYPTSGFGGFNPQEYDDRIGRMISLPCKKEQ